MGHVAEKDINHREEKSAAKSKQEKANERYDEVKPCPIKWEPEDNEKQN
jgi:outer membrane murein-binding lipoprotein Lpp